MGVKGVVGEKFKRLWRLESNNEVKVAEKRVRDGEVWFWKWDWRREIRGREVCELNNLLNLLQDWRPNTNRRDDAKWFLFPEGELLGETIKINDRGKN